MRRICLLILLGGVSVVAQGTPPQQAPQDPEAAAREALARPVSIGSVPFLIQHARSSNVAARLAEALKHKQPAVRAVAARSIYVLAGSRYAGPLAEALAAERDPVAGAEMARALLAIRGTAADPEAMDAARRLGPEALDAVALTLAQSRPLDVLPWLTDLPRIESLLPVLRRAEALDPERVSAALKTHDIEVGIGDRDPRWSRRTEWRLPEPFVPGLDAAVAAAAGCRPNADEIAVVQIAYGPGGQVRQIRVDATRASPECRQAAGVLAALEIAPLGEAPPNDRTDYLVQVFAREALECERRSSRGQRAQPAGENGTLKEPRKVRDVRPVYPKQMIAARIEGSVIVEAIIDRAGCVNRAAVIGEPRPEFSIAALAAVAQWRYAPTLLNGEPVSVIMTVTSTFALR